MSAIQRENKQKPFFFFITLAGMCLKGDVHANVILKKNLFNLFHSLLQKFDFPSMRFSLYFLGYEDKKEIPTDVSERTAWTFSRRATIELTQ